VFETRTAEINDTNRRFVRLPQQDILGFEVAVNDAVFDEKSHGLQHLWGAETWANIEDTGAKEALNQKKQTCQDNRNHAHYSTK
jgi:hypothetical protein